MCLFVVYEYCVGFLGWICCFCVGCCVVLCLFVVEKESCSLFYGWWNETWRKKTLMLIYEILNKRMYLKFPNCKHLQRWQPFTQVCWLNKFSSEDFFRENLSITHSTCIRNYFYNLKLSVGDLTVRIFQTSLQFFIRKYSKTEMESKFSFWGFFLNVTLKSNFENCWSFVVYWVVLK